MAEGEIEAGQLLAGKYLVERLIGRGGMGSVVAAVHQRLNERVAIKVLSSFSGDAISRFLREARVAARIRSEHVARVMDLGELQSGVPYIVMEYLEGEDLSALLKRSGRLTVDEAVDFVLQACVALADAHVLGVVHRDLKPANLFCTRRSDGRRVIKVLDFGISKLTDAESPAHLEGTPDTLTAMTMGTPLYMSPEQMRSAKGVDVRTDIWALGIVLFELLAGEPPFRGESLAHLALSVTLEPAPALSRFRSDLPRGLEEVVRRCLEKDREQRFANVAELAHALEPFAPKQATLLVERIAAISRTATAASEHEAPTQNEEAAAEPHARDNITRVARVVPGTMAPWTTHSSVPSPSNHKRLLLAAPVIALVAAVGFGAGQLLRAGDSPIPSATPRAATPAPSSSERVLPQESASSPPMMPIDPPPPPSVLKPSGDGPESIQPRPAPPKNPSKAPVVPSKPVTAPLHSSAQPPAPSVRATGNIGALPASDCNPPYTIDAQGRKHFKRQCFSNTKP
ncbi:MAG TPA: protein kinase [Polyangiaceae bacterium]|nr:protein kinase [Polyangiaceae bacterium]